MTGVTLDSNIYVSAFEFGGICARLIGMARMGMIRVDTSEAILKETESALRRLTNIVGPTQTSRAAADPDDNRILECAVEARSHFIVTEDKGLLRIGSFQGIGIVRAREFLV